ncbi:tetratricopeptide repeat protein [Nonomuraea antimicrobica]
MPEPGIDRPAHPRPRDRRRVRRLRRPRAGAPPPRRSLHGHGPVLHLGRTSRAGTHLLETGRPAAAHDVGLQRPRHHLRPVGAARRGARRHGERPGPRRSRRATGLPGHLPLQPCGDLRQAGPTGRRDRDGAGQLGPVGRVGQPVQEGITFDALADAHRRAGQLDEAESAYRTAVTLQQEADYHLGTATSLWGLGQTYHDLGRDNEAWTCWRRSLDILRDVGLLTQDEVDHHLSQAVPDTPGPIMNVL